MNKMRLKIVATSILLLATALPVSADLFYRTGTVEKVLTTEAGTYGGCMIRLSTSIGNGCPNSGWVSLDCANTYYSNAESNRKYAMVLTALASNKMVSVKVDNIQKHGGYCVAQRVDILN